MGFIFLPPLLSYFSSFNPSNVGMYLFFLLSYKSLRKRIKLRIWHFNPRTKDCENLGLNNNNFKAILRRLHRWRKRKHVLEGNKSIFGSNPAGNIWKSDQSGSDFIYLLVLSCNNFVIRINGRHAKFLLMKLIDWENFKKGISYGRLGIRK